jgi:deazaflavin-dependent oxidoreductase (nitroreductase family)
VLKTLQTIESKLDLGETQRLACAIRNRSKRRGGTTWPNIEAIDTDRLIADPRAIDQLNQCVIKEFRANYGKVGGPMEGMPVLLLTMTGAKTGRTLLRPLCYSRDGDRLVIIASYGGAPRNPPWHHNLVANPLVTVEVGTEKFKARATQVYGAERDRLFAAHA